MSSDCVLTHGMLQELLGVELPRLAALTVTCVTRGPEPRVVTTEFKNVDGGYAVAGTSTTPVAEAK